MTQTIASIPDSHLDLLTGPIVVGLATVNRDGQPQVTPVWCDFDGTHVRINSAQGRQKDRNMRARPKVTILAIDPTNPYRWLEVRGTIVEIIDDQEIAVGHINTLSALYRNEPDYYKRNESMRGVEKRVMYRVLPTNVNFS